MCRVHQHGEMSTRRTTVLIATAGLLAVCAYAAVALMQILVWNPEAAVPGLTADQIWAEVAAAQQGPPGVLVVGIVVFGPLLAAVMFALFVATDAGVWPTVAGYLGLLAMGAVGYFFASFGPGMGLADTYFINGGDYSRASLALAAVSALAVVLLLVLFVGAAWRARRERLALARA